MACCSRIGRRLEALKTALLYLIWSSFDRAHLCRCGVRYWRTFGRGYRGARDCGRRFVEWRGGGWAYRVCRPGLISSHIIRRRRRQLGLYAGARFTELYSLFCRREIWFGLHRHIDQRLADIIFLESKTVVD